MKNDELQLFNDYSNISDTQKNVFLSNIESDLKYNVHYFKCEYDFTWLDVMEDTIRYIENITKEPKVFILNNEEIVQVEKSKKISVESVVHLTQHSGFVSKYDEKTGEIRPSKILNITREETMDIYENRFIYTLINKMVDFIENYGILALENNSSMNNKTLSYNAQTKNYQYQDRSGALPDNAVIKDSDNVQHTTRQEYRQHLQSQPQDNQHPYGKGLSISNNNQSTHSQANQDQTNQVNPTKAKELPQTGNDNKAGLGGLALASLTAMFGLGKRKERY